MHREYDSTLAGIKKEEVQKVSPDLRASSFGGSFGTARDVVCRHPEFATLQRHIYAG